MFLVEDKNYMMLMTDRCDRIYVQKEKYGTIFAEK